jgi:hypothetical protein
VVPRDPELHSLHKFKASLRYETKILSERREGGRKGGKEEEKRREKKKK